MRVLVIGSSGNMGKRYCAIIRHLKHNVVKFDLTDKISMPLPSEYDCCIIATPVSEHLRFLKPLIASKTPVLCEKPLSFDVLQVMAVARHSNMLNSPAFMVNNWAFVGGEYRDPMSVRNIVINCYNTGNDGDWDLIQPLYLVEDLENFECVHGLPWLSVVIDGCVYGRDDFDKSYVDMVRAFIDQDLDKLWLVERMGTAHHRVVEYGQRL